MTLRIVARRTDPTAPDGERYETDDGREWRRTRDPVYGREAAVGRVCGDRIEVIAEKGGE